MYFTDEQIAWIKIYVKKVKADERKSVVEEFRAYLKTVIPCEMPQDIWNAGVDNTCNRILRR